MTGYPGPFESPLTGYSLIHRWGSEWALGDGGPLCVVGELPSALVASVGASASDVVLVGDPVRLQATSAALSQYSPVAVSVESLEEGVPEIEGGYRRLLVTQLGDDDNLALDLLDEALGACVDGAEIYFLSQWPRDVKRIEKLLRAHCHSTLERPTDAPPEWCVLSGVRKTSQAVEEVEEEGHVLDVTVILLADGTAAETEPVLLDLLLRQHHPASDVIVLDTAEDPAERLPDNLFGFPDHALSKVALVTAGDTESGAALGQLLNDTLSVVSSPYVVFLRGSERLAPHHLAALMLKFEQSPDAVAVVSNYLLSGGALGWPRRELSYQGHLPLRHFLDFGPPPESGVMLRMDTLRALSGFDPRFGDDADLLWGDLWHRLLMQGAVASCPLPLVQSAASLGGAGPEPELFDDLVPEVPARMLLRLAREERESSKEHREMVAKARIARSMLATCDLDLLPHVVELVADSAQMAKAARHPAALARSPAPPQSFFDALFWMAWSLSRDEDCSVSQDSELYLLLDQEASPSVHSLAQAMEAIGEGGSVADAKASAGTLLAALSPYLAQGCDPQSLLGTVSPSLLAADWAGAPRAAVLTSLSAFRPFPKAVGWPECPWDGI